MLTLFIASLCLIPFVGAAAPTGTPTRSPPTCGSPHRHEPLVIYDINGSTFVGPIYLTMTVYNDGSVQISQVDTGFGPAKAEYAFVGPDAARQLRLDLASAGATSLCDDPAMASDAPLRTLTILGDATDTRAHTYSWWRGSGPYLAAQVRITAFIQAAFPTSVAGWAAVDVMRSAVARPPGATVKFDAVQVSGGDASAVLRTLVGRSADFGGCVNSDQTDGPLRGTVTLNFTIISGRVTSAGVLENTATDFLGDRHVTVENCMVGVLRATRFASDIDVQVDELPIVLGS